MEATKNRLEQEEMFIVEHLRGRQENKNQRTEDYNPRDKNIGTHERQNRRPFYLLTFLSVEFLHTHTHTTRQSKDYF